MLYEVITTLLVIDSFGDIAQQSQELSDQTPLPGSTLGLFRNNFV